MRPFVWLNWVFPPIGMQERCKRWKIQFDKAFSGAEKSKLSTAYNSRQRIPLAKDFGPI